MMTIPCKFDCLRGTCQFPGIKPKTCPTGIQVRKKISARHYSHNKKSVDNGLAPLEKSDVETAFINSVQSGFVCPWCERQMDLWATNKNDKLWGIVRAASLDHIIPIRSGKSTNHIYNLQVICHECNTVKGLTDPVHWKTTVENLKKNHGITEFHKWLDNQYGWASSREIKSGWWGNKKHPDTPDICKYPKREIDPTMKLTPAYFDLPIGTLIEWGCFSAGMDTVCGNFGICARTQTFVIRGDGK